MCKEEALLPPRKGVQGAPLSQFPAEESQRLVGTRTQALHKGLQKPLKECFVSCQINVPFPLQPWCCWLGLLRLTWEHEA